MRKATSRASALALLCGLVAGLCGARAQAQDAPQIDCEKAESQMELNYCADQDYAEADQALNEIYRQAMTRLRKADADLAATPGAEAGAVEALKAAQRGWIAYRDGQCILAGLPVRGGTMEPMLVLNCQADLTRKRTQELKETIAALDQ
ncbi:lysozyme inhibitor LprI family protein [Rhizobium rhizosphaerae]|uniref:lysozyme inhibitor LprI family protein n=1 Tax=Xaviernesmea rhizosphaerae TaxID=1672749 RepID=UPI0009C09BE7